MMDARAYLSQLGALREDIKRMEEMIRETDEKLTSLGSMRYDRERVQATPENRLEKGVIGKAQQMEKLEKLYKKYLATFGKIVGQIDQMENATYRRALKLVYVDGLTIRRAAARMNYTEDWMYHLLSRARGDFQKRFLK